jgi:hypothetical protein
MEKSSDVRLMTKKERGGICKREDMKWRLFYPRKSEKT